MENNFQINSINFNKINNIQNNEDILLNRVVDNLKILKQIGKGGFSKTYLAEDENNNYFSIKTIIVGKTDLRLIDLIDREIEFIKKISHPNIPKFYKSIKNINGSYLEINIIQEYIEGKNLYEIIKDGKTFNEKEVVEILIKISKILEFLHNFNPTIIHRDIKPSNIMIDDSGKIFLIDFGAIKEKVSFEYTSKSGLSTIIGTQGYMPIEQFENRVSIQSDIYSLGLTAIYLLSKKEPLELPKMGLNIDFIKFVNISQNFKYIINTMIDPDYTLRYKNISELRKDLYSLDSTTPQITTNHNNLYKHEVLEKYIEEDEQILLVKNPEIKDILKKKGVSKIFINGILASIFSIIFFLGFTLSLRYSMILYQGIGIYVLAIISILFILSVSGFLVGLGLILTPKFASKYSKETKYILTNKKIIVLPKSEKINRTLFNLPIRIIKIASKHLIIYGNIKEIITELPTILIRILENNFDPEEVNLMESQTNNVKVIYYQKLKNYSLEKIEYKDGSGDLIFYDNNGRNKQIYMKLISVNDINSIEKFLIEKFKDI